MGNGTHSEWLTRRQVARLTGLTDDQVAALDGIDLHPVRRKDRSWIYDPAELLGLLGGKATGSLTARVFTMFRQGKSLTDVVIESVQPARRIRDLREEYDVFVGALTLDGEMVDALKSALGVNELRDGVHLVEILKAQLQAQRRTGFEEGRTDALDLGEVVNPKTGERKRIVPR